MNFAKFLRTSFFTKHLGTTAAKHRKKVNACLMPADANNQADPLQQRWNNAHHILDFRCCLRYFSSTSYLILKSKLLLLLINRPSSKVNVKMVMWKISETSIENVGGIDVLDFASFKLLTLSCLVVTKRSTILKQTCSFQLQVCLSMCDLFVTTRY